MAGDAAARRVLHVEPIGGAAGDMLLAALLDAGAPWEAVRRAVEAVIPGRFELALKPVARAGLRATLLRVSDAPAARTGGGGGPHRRPFRDLRAAVERADLSEGTRVRALAVLDRLAGAEARVHGVAAGEVELHRLGDDDTLLDVVGIAAALDALEVDDIAVSSIPVGVGEERGGEVELGDGAGSEGGAGPAHGHGVLPLPPPATLELLRGFELRPGGHGETVTPTGAAVLAALGRPAAAAGFPAMRLEAVGYGAGHRDPPERPNVVRVALGVRSGSLGSGAGERGPAVRDLVVLEANLDDLTPELVADAAAALFEAGALDAWTVPIHMKKGRPAVLLAALCEPAAEERVRRAFFESSSTFGVRSAAVRRAELDRRTATVQVAGGTVRVKLGLLWGRVVSAAPEHDDVAALATAAGRPVREVHEEAAAAAHALRLEPAAPEPPTAGPG